MRRLAAITFVAIATAASPSAQARICGDADGSGSVTVTDGVVILQQAAGLSSSCADRACDIDGQGGVTVTDGVLTLRKASGLATALSCGTRFGEFVKTVRTQTALGDLHLGPPPTPAPGAPQTVIAVSGVSQVQSGAETTLTVDLAQPAETLVVAFQQDGVPVDGFVQIPTGSSASVPLALEIAENAPAGTASDLAVAASAGEALGRFKTKAVSVVGVEDARCPAEPTDIAIRYGSSIACSLDVTGDSDLFRFQGAQGDVIRIDAASPTRPCIELVAPDNSRIQACQNDFAQRIDTQLSQTGTYTIIMRSLANFTGDYTLALERLLPPSPNAEPISFGESRSGTLSPAGDMDIFFFAGRAGTNIVLDASSSTRPCIELVAPDNSRVRSCENSFAQRIDTQLPQNGSYTIIMRSVANFTGDYSLTAQCVSASCSP